MSLVRRNAPPAGVVVRGAVALAAVVAIAGMALFGCAPAVPGGVSATGGQGGGAFMATGGGGANTGGTAGAGSGGAGQGGGGGTSAESCPEIRPARRTSGTVLQLPVEVFSEGAPFLFGQPNARAAGGTVTPLNLRFYVSGVALLRANADPVPVDLVTEAGTLEPYGVHLFNGEDAASTTIRVQAPAGSFTGISFLFGLDGACDARTANSSKAPLSATSQMSWEHFAGYLFLRYEGRFDPPANADGGVSPGAADGSATDAGQVPPTGSTTPPPAIHMGGRPLMPLAPVITLPGSLSIPAAGGASKTVRLSMDEVFRGAITEVDLTGFINLSGDEATAGERLRRNAPLLHLFSFAP